MQVREFMNPPAPSIWQGEPGFPAPKRRVAAGTATQRGKNWGGWVDHVFDHLRARLIPRLGAIPTSGDLLVQAFAAVEAPGDVERLAL